MIIQIAIYLIILFGDIYFVCYLIENRKEILKIIKELFKIIMSKQFWLYVLSCEWLL